MPHYRPRDLISALSSIDVGPATRATPRAERGHDKDRGADPGDRRLGRGLGDVREEPPASAGGLRYELRVSRLARMGRLEVTPRNARFYWRYCASASCANFVHSAASSNQPSLKGLTVTRAIWWLSACARKCSAKTGELAASPKRSLIAKKSLNRKTRPRLVQIHGQGPFAITYVNVPMKTHIKYLG
jgi:hypothetical protein